MRCRALLLLVLLTACSDDYEKQLKSARSWSATALVVGHCWVREEVSSAYAHAALEKAADQLRKGPLPEAAEPVDELLEAVDREDRRAARELLDGLER